MSTIHTKLNPVSVGKLSPNMPYAFDLKPGEPDIGVLQQELALLDLRKVRLIGEIRASGASDWELSAKLGATVVQPCVATLEPVTTRIDAAVTRRFLKKWPDETEFGEETEMPEDDTLEKLGDEIDLYGVLCESLALHLPDYPRVDGALAQETQARPEGAAPITSIDDATFSALSNLKERLEKDGK